MRIVVYTTITNDFDNLHANQIWDGCDWVCFTDGTVKQCGEWQLREACDIFKDPCRNAKIHKILPQQYLNDYDVWVFMDGIFENLIPIPVLIDRYLTNVDMAIYRHPHRATMYEEAALLKILPKHQFEVEKIEAQVNKYKQIGWDYNKLWEGGVLFRCNNNRVKLMNLIWWSEVCRFSRRDQLSLPFAIDGSGVKINVIPGHPRDEVYFNYYFHKHKIKELERVGMILGKDYNPKRIG